jgi:hypothetical protein
MAGNSSGGRDEAFLRSEIRRLVERARVAFGLPESAVVGCTDAQIAEILDAQQVAALPPALDELLRVAGVHARGTVLGELLPASGAGWDVMLGAKEHARQTASISGSKETFGPDRVVFFSDPGGNVLWVPTSDPDPAVWALTERTLIPPIAYARLACWLEHEVVMAEQGWPTRKS